MASQEKKSKFPKMTLYQCPYFRSFKCLWLIHELGIQDDVQLIKLNTIKNKESEEFKEYVKSVHPHGTIPALVVEGEGVILESSAICLYLADLYGKLAPALDKRREFYDWVMYGGITMEEAIDFLYYQWVDPRGKPDPEGVTTMSQRFDICLKRLSKTLEGRDYILGDSFSVVDTIVGYSVWGADMDIYNGGCLVKDYPVVKAYIKRLTERPAFKDTIKAQGE